MDKDSALPYQDENVCLLDNFTMVLGKPSKKIKSLDFFHTGWGGGSGPNIHFYKSGKKCVLALLHIFAFSGKGEFWRRGRGGLNV